MNIKRLIFCFIVTLLCFGCSREIPSEKISVINNLNSERLGKIVEINISDISFVVDKTELSNLAVFSKVGQLTSQIIDSDNDGSSDQLIFQDDFSANETKEYEVKLLKTPVKFDSKVYVTFIEGREDIAWENDKVAFRMYGPPLINDVNNGIDVWSKSVDYLIIDKWYKEEEEGKSYHIDHGEGADFYSVGKSLGTGGSALLKDGTMFQSGVYASYEILANGPLQLKFKLTNTAFDVDGEKVSEEKIVTLNAGSQLNKIESSYSLMPEGVSFSAGLVIRENLVESIDQENSIIALWGNNSDKEEDGQTGIAVVYPASGNISKTDTDPAHLLVSDSSAQEAYLYYTGACWTKAQKINSLDEWKEYLSNFKKELESPLSVKVLK